MALTHSLLRVAYTPLRMGNNLLRYLAVKPTRRLRVLIYHDIAPQEQERFAAQLRWLSRSWTFVSPLRFGAMVRGEESIKGANLLLSKGCYVDSEACFIKRTTVNRLGPLDESLRYACDYEYFVRAGFEFDFAYTRDTLVAWRIHAGQESATNRNRYKESRAVLGRYFSHAGVTLSTRFVIARNYGRSLAAEIYHEARNRFGFPVATG